MSSNGSTNYRHPAWQENAFLYDLFDYPQTGYINPAVAHAPGIYVEGCGTTAFRGLYLPVPGVAREYVNASDMRLFHSTGHGQWELGGFLDDPDYFYYSAGDSPIGAIWGTWVNESGDDPVPVVTANGVVGKLTGKGWSGAWYPLSSTVAEFGVLDEALPFAANGISLKTNNKCIYCPMSSTPYPDAELLRDIDYTKIPSHIRTTGGKLGKPGTSIWAAYVIHPLTSIPASRWFGVKFASQCGWFGRNYNQATWGIEYPPVNSALEITRGTKFVVQRIAFAGDGSACATSLWVNPTPAIHPSQATPDESPIITDAVQNFFETTLVNIAISNEAKFGSLRIGETYFSVAPGMRTP